MLRHALLLAFSAAALSQDVHVKVDPHAPGSFLRGSDNWKPIAEAAKLP